MCTSLIPCPLCAQPHFNSLESLRIGLIKVATENLVCPICKDIFIGLDKLTIHLFSHCEDILTNNSNSESENLDSVKPKKEPIEEVKVKKGKHQRAENESASLKRKLPVFNMNALPFIGIPESISENIATENIGQDFNVNDESRQKTLSERCDICGFYFLGKNILHVHKKLIHNYDETADSPANLVSKYSCHLCSKAFKMKGSLMVHLRMVHLDVEKNEDKSKETPQIKNKVLEEKIAEENKVNKKINESKLLRIDHEPGNNKQWKCDICQKLFTTKYFLKKHKRLHTGEMPYSCTQCNKTFTFQQSYHKHLLYHNDDKPHTCSHCGRSFKELSTLHNHQRIHTGEKPFSCESCGKCFRQRVSYLVHRRIHTGVMPYKCTACDKSFRYKVSQRTHKCTSQPPGTVIRQSGELVQKLIKNQSTSIEVCQDKLELVSKIDPVLDLVDHSLEMVDKKCDSDSKNIIDELINDSINRIDFGELRNAIEDPVVDLYAMVAEENIAEQDLPSPSDKLKNLRLSSCSNSPGNCDSFSPHQNINNDDFRQGYASMNAPYHENGIFEQIYR